MSIYEIYISVIAFLILLQNVVTLCWNPVCRRTKYRYAGRDFFFNKYFSTVTTSGKRLFWLAFIWLSLFIPYHWNLLLNIYLDFVRGF